MRIWVSFSKTEEPFISLILLETETKSIEKIFNFPEIDEDNKGFRGITYDPYDNFYYATEHKVIKTNSDLEDQIVVYNDGINLHQIDWIKTTDNIEGLAICDAGRNMVLMLIPDDIVVLHIGLDGLMRNSNHITSMYHNGNFYYFVYHNNLRGGKIIRHDDEEVFSGNLFQPHNVYVSPLEDILIVCNSKYNRVSKIISGYDVKELELDGYTRGMALSQDGILFVGEFDRNAIPKISIIDSKSFQKLDEIILPELHREILGEIYDIRIEDHPDLCMSAFNELKLGI